MLAVRGRGNVYIMIYEWLFDLFLMNKFFLPKGYYFLSFLSIIICVVMLNNPASPSKEMASVNDYCNLLQMCCYFQFDRNNIKTGYICFCKYRNSMLYSVLYELLFKGVEICFCKIAADRQAYS